MHSFLFSCLPSCPIQNVSDEARTHIVAAQKNLNYAHSGRVMDTKKYYICA